MLDTKPVRFKFLFGEMLLGSWCPLFVDAGRASDVPNMQVEYLLRRMQEHAGHNIVLRKADPRQFALGVSRVGDGILYVSRIEKTYMVDIDGTFDDYLSRRSSKSRYNIKRSIKRIQEASSGEVLTIFTAPEEMGRFQKIAHDISRRTYQTRLLDAGLPGTPEYLSAMQNLASRGEARGYILNDQQQPIAFAWCTSSGRHFTYGIVGYLPECASQSPGTVLLALIIEDLHKCRRYDVLDFGVGECFYKASFSTSASEHVDVYAFAPSFKSALLVHLHAATDRLSKWVGDRLEAWGLKSRIKTWMRSLKGAS